ncbi:MAG: molybdenum cofactor guanylyltransferase [Planctomycetes bacterium]|nr:molybdenum cofactor guanylyltransferase [Planctomycetota bacterium]
MELTGLILAGGLATRMDGEKPLRVLSGKTLLQHAIDLMRPLVSEVIVCSGAREFGLPSEIKQVADDLQLAGKGPLAGILAGVKAASFENALLLPCDLPFLGQGVLGHIAQALKTSECAYVMYENFPQPLIAGVRCQVAIAPIEQALARGNFRVSPIWKGLDGKQLLLQVGDGVLKSEQEFLNINTFEDLNSAAGNS